MKKDAKYSIEQCKERDVTYAAPLKVRVRLINKKQKRSTNTRFSWEIYR